LAGVGEHFAAYPEYNGCFLGDKTG